MIYRRGVSALLGLSVLVSTVSTRAESAPPLTHDAYVWQRAWTEPVRTAVREHSGSFSELVLLHSEVSWSQNRPTVIAAGIDYASLTNSSCGIGLALRVGPFSGKFSRDDSVSRFLVGLAANAISQARSNRLSIRELQIDFDCAESKLEGYRLWLEALHQKISPIPLTITALPAWLKHPEFGKLVAATDGYVLQVHSVERPRGIDSDFTLCDPSEARRAVELAGRFGVPFRVALPTYGYWIAFNREGRFFGLSAEGPKPEWGREVQVREVRADPASMALLVQNWSTNRSVAMRGVIWYRLPTIVDNLNWRWPTLAAIVGSQSLRESFRSDLRRVEPGLVEINLVNDGELDFSSRLAIELHWQNARLVAGDALRGFELAEGDPDAAKFQTRSTFRLGAGEHVVVGWLRFDHDCEVQVELKKISAAADRGNARMGGDPGVRVRPGLSQ